MNTTRWSKCWLAAMALTGMVMAAPALADGGRSYPGVTKPSDSRDLSFNGPGVVSKLSVKEGDVVKAGESLIDQDDSVEQASLAAAQIEAKSNVQIDAAKAKLAYAQAELKRKQTLADENAISASELQEAQLEVSMDQKQLELAGEEKDQKALEAAEDEAKIKLKHLVSPIDGIVLKINTHAGEVPTQDKPVMTIVKNDPLWVEVDLHTQDVKQIKIGQPLEFRYAGEEWQPAMVIFIAPEADARSDTQKVRMQMANPSHRDSGMQVEVRMPDNLASASTK